MQSSYSIIKNEQVFQVKGKDIETHYEIPKVDEYKEFRENSARIYIDSYENLAKTMLENSRRQSDEIISKAYEDIRRMEDQSNVNIQNKAEMELKIAYDKGFSKGNNDGYEKSQQEAKVMMESVIEKANNKRDEIINEALKTLTAAKEEYDRYLEDKSVHLKDVILNFSETVLKREVQSKDSLDNLIMDLISQSKKSKVLIIRCNDIYCSDLKEKVGIFKTQQAFMGEIFVIPDNSVSIGNLIIEKNNGKIEAGVDLAMEELKHILDGID